MKLIERIKKQLDDADLDTFHVSKEQIQQDLANKLRQQAIGHLAYSNEPAAQEFRKTYYQSPYPGQPTTQEFFKKQSVESAYGGVDEARALAEKYGINLEYINADEENPAPIQVYDAGKDAPKISLKYVGITGSASNHWFLNKSTDTKGDGNCLYNAFAQGLQEQVLLEQVINAQEEKLSGFTRTQAPIPDTEAPSTVGRADEQQQIQDDYKLALKLAREELDPDSPSETKEGYVSDGLNNNKGP